MPRCSAGLQFACGESHEYLHTSVRANPLARTKLIAHELCSDTYSTGCTHCPHNPEVLETVTLFHASITQIRIPIGGLREGRPIYPVLGAEAGLHD